MYILISFLKIQSLWLFHFSHNLIGKLNNIGIRDKMCEEEN